ncbi:unnamed protein product [Vitrella brassicaformis CCMP3155]|uniref:P-type domain-containing protein n=1 Tax=Vitrella brassicaformis (strain CCMP3155) TaxID=1169540 RepID=A0A0G4EM37_VITBC|nr:unnamed protein product [Vitrella brassicaformis CCMP3155]|eukprot:CEL98505.1 unnamed protein product [Vitrella brassicaformis CCMP3155]
MPQLREGSLLLTMTALLIPPLVRSQDHHVDCDVLRCSPGSPLIPAAGPFAYVHPLPDATFVSPFTSIIMRPDHNDNHAHRHQQVVNESVHVAIEGEDSGTRNATMAVSRDNLTIVLDIDGAFVPGERVTVSVPEGITLATTPWREDGEEHHDEVLGGFWWQFTIAPRRTAAHYFRAMRDFASSNERRRHIEHMMETHLGSGNGAGGRGVAVTMAAAAEEMEDETDIRPFFWRESMFTHHDDRRGPTAHSSSLLENATASAKKRAIKAYKTLPDDYPAVDVLVPPVKGKTADGVIIFAPLRDPLISVHQYLSIVDEHGEPVWYHRFPHVNEKWHGWSTRDFKMQQNGLLSHVSDRGGWSVLDHSYEEVRHIFPKNGYITNDHDFQMSKDDHVLLLAYDYRENMDMTWRGGSPHTKVMGFVIQELDDKDNLVWQWNSWDHLHGGLEKSQNKPDGGFFDHLHVNSACWTPDGHVLISLRHLSQVIKINRKTGAIMWKLGGPDGDFTFHGKDPGPSWQHDSRLHEDGRLSLFDNGNGRDPPWSRAVEYEIDEKKLVAKRKWEYRHDPDRYGLAMGGFDYLDNGNMVVNFAGVEPDSHPFYTEVTRKGEKVLELSINPGMAYRAMKYDWWGAPSSLPDLVLDAERASLHFSWNGATHIKEWKVYGGVDPDDMDLIDTIAKKHFEHSLELADTRHSPINSCVYYRVEAVTKHHKTSKSHSSPPLLSPWCSSMGAMCTSHSDDSHRQDCASDTPFVTQQQCHQLGCCFRPPDGSTKRDVPWCFRPRTSDDGRCGSGKGQVDAGWDGIQKNECLGQGACWHETGEAGVPWCFHAADTCKHMKDKGNKRLVSE